MRRRKRLLGGEEATENFWPAFTDLTSTIALILFVLVLLAFIQNLISSKNLAHSQDQLAQTMQRLRGSQEQIAKAEQRLRLLAAEIEAGQEQLLLSETKVQEQQEVISESNDELAALRAQLRGIAVFRLEMLEKVKASIEGELQRQGSNAPQASIGENGNIILDESLLFESDSFHIKKEGKPFLDSLANAFATVLADESVRNNIDVVLVQGHTDKRGSVPYNRDLSAKRANAVLNYLFLTREDLEKQYGRYFASSAYSEFRPINSGSNKAAFRENRRIEISVVLRDANIREVIDEYMHNIDESLRSPQGADAQP